ncbi:demethylmenaquinone methyltransferase [Planococcus lenghuensis]|uniref:Demethylmenaquinone methyltransferase n=1 Tax=Planococcus lenghuensis TaxID=2213202 RepID=A0A1Q2KZK2_9BACL|nr:demethylmenaquinone methyltransferase [Planococcus lenghuensis]AQQ53630.1 bifunctional demethylmenaquinone methyltransferase/2-methoxy-6-polyprenyl-1,4-benzoquinol methylase [Planococcus lenghuensis]
MQKTKEQRVHEVFEKISGNYDQMNSVISFQQHVRWRKDAMEKMQVPEGAAALDVCCGTADWTIALAEAAGPAGRVVGLDFSRNMLNVGVEKTKDMPQVELVHGNAMQLPFPDNSFDFVTIGFGLRNVPDYRQALAEMHRVLRPGGMIACLETSQPESRLFRPVFRLYFRFIMPAFGKLFAKSYKEYSWLQESAKAFPDMKGLARLFASVGFQEIKYKPYSGGAAALHIGFKNPI